MDGWTAGRLDACTDARTDRRVGGWMDGRASRAENPQDKQPPGLTQVRRTAYRGILEIRSKPITSFL